MKHYFADFLHSFGLKVITFKKNRFSNVKSHRLFQSNTKKTQASSSLKGRGTNKHRQLSIRPEKKSEKKLEKKQVNVKFFWNKKGRLWPFPPQIAHLGRHSPWPPEMRQNHRRPEPWFCVIDLTKGQISRYVRKIFSLLCVVLQAYHFDIFPAKKRLVDLQKYWGFSRIFPISQSIFDIFM